MHQRKDKGAEIQFDPIAVLEAEFEQDDAKQRELQEKMFGKKYMSSKYDPTDPK